jgi:hypothetical protein
MCAVCEIIAWVLMALRWWLRLGKVDIDTNWPVKKILRYCFDRNYTSAALRMHLKELR